MSEPTLEKVPTMKEEIEVVLGQVYPAMRDIAQRVSELTEGQVLHLFRTLTRTERATTYIKESVQSAFDDIIKGRVL